jgi:phosphoglycolate phosphatase-like HAD superfamily hydrolase
MNFIFDFDGTVIDSLGAFIAVFNKNVRDNKDPLTPQEIQKFRGMSSRRAIRNLGVRWWQIPKLLVRGMPDFRALIPDLDPCKGIPEVLRALQQRGDKLFMVTSNQRDIVDEFLKQYNLDSYFTDIATGASVFRKSGYIRKLMRDNMLKRRQTVYVGDETRDIQAARLAGVKIVSVTWGFNTRQILKKRRPNFLIDEPKRLLEVKL